MARQKRAQSDADVGEPPKRRSSRRAAAAVDTSETKPETPAKAPPKPAKKTAAKPASKPAKASAKVSSKPAKTPAKPPAKGEAPATNGERASPDPDPASIPATNPEAARHEGQWYWLMKAEPETRFENGIDVRFSIDDLRAKTKPEGWDGIRAYAARNHMRAMNAGDMAFFYHSNCKEPCIAGTMEIVREFSEDKSARRPGTPYYDPQSTRDKPRWSLVHVEFRSKFAVPITLKELRELGKPGGPLEDMQMLRQGRLSVSRVSADEWKALCKIADDKAKEAGAHHET